MLRMCSTVAVAVGVHGHLQKSKGRAGGNPNMSFLQEKRYRRCIGAGRSQTDEPAEARALASGKRAHLYAVFQIRASENS